MDNIELHAFGFLFLAIVAIAFFSMPAYQDQEFIYSDSSVMQEPFSSSPLITYPSLEASREG